MPGDGTFFTFCHWNPTGELVPFPQNKGCLHPVGKQWVTVFLWTCHSLQLVIHHGSIISLLQGYYFHTDNPFKDWPGAFEEGLKKMKEGDLPVTILYLEAAILQEPNDAEVFTAVPLPGRGKGNSLQHGMMEWFLGSNLCQSWLSETLDSKGYELVGAFK